MSDEDSGGRLDQFLVNHSLPASRSKLKRHIDAGACLVNGEPGRPAQRLQTGDEVCYQPPPPAPSGVVAQDIPLAVLHEDEQVIVVDKAAGMVVHPAAGHADGTLVNALLGRFGQLPGAGASERAGIVHRLDKDTSGVMVVARTDEAHAALAAQFACHSVERHYLALVLGAPAARRGGAGTFDTFHGRHPVHRKKFSSKVTRGRRAVTHYRVLERLGGASLVQATLETGRTHQVRVHFSDAGHPLLGDPLYARPPHDPLLRELARGLARQALHARSLAFDHPGTGERLRFQSDPPADMSSALARLREEMKS